MPAVCALNGLHAPPHCLPGVIQSPRYPANVSLFDADDVAPPEDCSRCGRAVAKTSLFCPACGQSVVNPLPAPPEPGPETEQADEPAEAPEDDTPDESEKTVDTLSRATQWIKRTLGGSVEVPREEVDTEAGDPEDPLVREKPPTYSERLQQSSRARARFVLTDTSGRSFTLGEMPGGIGSGDEAPEGNQLHWIHLSADDGSVDAVHLRFGVDDGVLWVEDANSVFGTIVTEPGRSPLQCVPYERYFIVRGTELRLGSVVLTLG